MDYAVLVNKNNKLDMNHYKINLVPVKSLYKDNMLLEEETYKHWLKLKKEVLKRGYCIEIYSAYRPYDYQEKLYKELVDEKGAEYASKAIALPGYSEHQTGLALDYCIYQNGKCMVEYEMESIEESAYTNSIAHQFGFIVRYPEGKEKITGYKYEPWHLRYVGEKLATYLYKNNLTLDEYYFMEEL